MLRVPRSVDMKASSVGTQVWKAEEKSVRNCDSGSQYSGREGASALKGCDHEDMVERESVYHSEARDMNGIYKQMADSPVDRVSGEARQTDRWQGLETRQSVSSRNRVVVCRK